MMPCLLMLIRAVKCSYSTATVAIFITSKNEPDPQLHLHLPQPGRDAAAEVQRHGIYTLNLSTSMSPTVQHYIKLGGFPSHLPRYFLILHLIHSCKWDFSHQLGSRPYWWSHALNFTGSPDFLMFFSQSSTCFLVLWRSFLSTSDSSYQFSQVPDGVVLDWWHDLALYTICWLSCQWCSLSPLSLFKTQYKGGDTFGHEMAPQCCPL